MRNHLCVVQLRLLLNNSRERRHGKGTEVLRGTEFIEPYSKAMARALGRIARSYHAEIAMTRLQTPGWYLKRK